MRSKQAEALSFLQTNLRQGPIDSSRLQQLAQAAGIGWRTINAVKKAAGAASRQKAKGWEFVLAGQDASTQDCRQDASGTQDANQDGHQDATTQDANAVSTANPQTAHADSVLDAIPQTANPAHVVDPDHAGKSSQAGAPPAHPLRKPRKSGKRPPRAYRKAMEASIELQVKRLFQMIEAGSFTEATLRMVIPVAHEAGRLYNERIAKFGDISTLPWDVRERLQEDTRLEAIHQAVKARPAFGSESDYEGVKRSVTKVLSECAT